MNRPRLLSSRAYQAGAGIIETMIGILIGLLVVLVVYNMLAVAEGYRRSTTGAADAQITGLLSHMLAGRDIANGGNGIGAGSADLINCILDDDGVTANTTLRPIPMVITDGGTGSDSFITWQSASPHVVWPVDFRPPGPTTPGGDIVVQSPNGFSDREGVSLPTVATPYWVVAMTNDTTGKCKLAQVTAATVPVAGTGEVTLTQGAIQTTAAYTGLPANAAGTPSRLLNLGPVGDSSRLRYDVDANAQLRTTDCMNRDWACAGATPNPIAQNVVLMKVQYGIDTDTPLNGTVDCWTPAIDGSGCGTGNWAAATVQNAAFTEQDIVRIIAIRIAIVVRSDEPDYELNLATGSRRLVAANGRPDVVLFNCSGNTDALCPNRITLAQGTPASHGAATCAPAIICDHWRYRAFETIIPLRNSIYGATIK